MNKTTVYLILFLVSLIGAAGNILLKIGTTRFGEIKPTNLLDPKFLLQYTFTPLIIIAMIAFFTGRLLTGSPLSVLGTGQTTIAITVGTQALTLFLEVITLGQRYTSKTCLGFIVGLISLVLVLNPQQV
jgi:drug/metabolite transporter (DMT)-like permease